MYSHQVDDDDPVFPGSPGSDEGSAQEETPPVDEQTAEPIPDDAAPEAASDDPGDVTAVDPELGVSEHDPYP